MAATGLPFETALEVTRAGNLFTTHTAVPAGFDRFDPALVNRYLGRFAQGRLGLKIDDLLALGRQNRNDASEPFNMAYLAIRGSGRINGVSRLHGKVSRHIFEPLFPRWPEADVPVGHVTNGVHVPSWDGPGADALWSEACGEKRWLGTTETLGEDFRRLPDERIWALRREARGKLVELRPHASASATRRRKRVPEEVEEAKHLLNPEILTLGFARRFATYKRTNLLLRDPARLLRMLTNAERPVQLILAGKAHPADKAGQALIQQWTQFIRSTEARRHVIFLGDYDMLLTKHLSRGSTFGSTRRDALGKLAGPAA